MKTTPSNFIRHELVGMSTHVLEATDPTLACREGMIVDESKETFLLATRSGDITVTKRTCVFGFRLPSGDLMRVDGQLLTGRPEERLKKSLRRH